MATAAEKLASNMNFGALGKASELRNRLLFTLGALVVFRLGTFLPIPGINPVALQQFFEQQSSGILGVFDTFSGGALRRMGIFALGVMPYISASIIMTLLQSSIPYLKSLKEQGSSGRRKIIQFSRYLTVLIAGLQGYGVILVGLLLFVITAPFVNSNISNLTNIYIFGLSVLAIIAVYFLAGKTNTIIDPSIYQMQIISELKIGNLSEVIYPEPLRQMNSGIAPMSQIAYSALVIFLFQYFIFIAMQKKNIIQKN